MYGKNRLPYGRGWEGSVEWIPCSGIATLTRQVVSGQLGSSLGDSAGERERHRGTSIQFYFGEQCVNFEAPDGHRGGGRAEDDFDAGRRKASDDWCGAWRGCGFAVHYQILNSFYKFGIGGARSGGLPGCIPCARPHRIHQRVVRVEEIASLENSRKHG